MAQEVVGRPRQIGDLGDQLWLAPMYARQNERIDKGSNHFHVSDAV